MRQTPLLERDAEVAAVVEAITDIRAGRGRLIVVEGEAGVGKTRLLAHLRQLPEAAGLPVFAARGSDLERQLAFGIVRQLFEPTLVTSSDAIRERLLAGAAGGAAPVFAARAAAPGFAAGHGTADADLAVLHGLYWLTVNLCENPTLLVVDDLHWSDAASLRYLAYLVLRLEDLPLLVVAVVRTGEPAIDDPVLQRVLAAPDVTILRPSPLSGPAATSLLESVLGRRVHPAFAATCFDATSGNPLLLQALAGSIAREHVEPSAANAHRVLEVGPRAVAHLVGARLANADAALVATARALAVLGPGAGVRAAAELAAELAAVDPLAAAEAVEELVRMGLLDPVSAAPPGGAVSYSHPLIEAAVYNAMSARERAESHGRAAAILARLGADPERVGVHLLKTPPTGPGETVAALGRETVAALGRAAVAAEKRGSAEAALAFLRRCLDEPVDGDPRLHLLLEAARVAVQVDLHAAVGLLEEEARRLAPDRPTRARVVAELGRAYGYLLEPARARDAFYEALADLPAEAEDQRRRLEATLLVGAFVVPGRLDVVRRLPALKALPAHDSIGGRMLQAAIAEHEMAECDPNARARARAALADGRLVREANGEGALVCGWLTLIAADDEAGVASLDAAVEQAHLYGSLRALAAACCFRALARLWLGQLAEAERDAREALRLAETGRVDMDPTFAGAYLADALIEQGRLGEAKATLRAVGVPGAPSPKPRYCALDSYARLLLHQGRHDAAASAATEAGQVWKAYGFGNPAIEGWRTEGSLALFALGRLDESHALAREELALAERWGAPRALGRALRVTGRLTGGADGIALLRRSVAVLEDSGARLELARSRLDLGGALRRAGQRTAARRELSEALDGAEVCGAVPLTELAATELRAAGYRPRRHRLTGVDALTPSELRVAEAAARGSTNREIAQSLFVTTKTVEVHLSNAFRKLGVHRRSEIVRHLGTRTGKPWGTG